MGAYLSQPKTDKSSTDEANEFLSVGASSMQGWRNSQEDAHNSILNFDSDTSFFAVYDGHGGAEVAAYCAERLPDFLKSLQSYKDGDLAEALRRAFLGFDKTLLDAKVVEVLKILARERNIGDGEDSEVMEEEDDEDLVKLHEESHLPLSDVLEQYQGCKAAPNPLVDRLKDTAAAAASSQKPQSPYLRGRRAAAVIADAVNRAAMDLDAKPEGSSTSAAAAAAAAKAAVALNDVGPSSSSALPKMDTDEPEEDSTVSSSSSSGSKSNAANANAAASAEDTEAEAAAASMAAPPALPVTSNGNSCTSPDSSHVKESEQNGSVTSSEAGKAIKEDVSTTSSTVAVKDSTLSNDDETVSGSSDAAKERKSPHTNGSSIGSSSGFAPNTSAPSGGDRQAITSTSKEDKVTKNHLAASTGEEADSTDDDADYDADQTSSEDLESMRILDYSSDELDEADEDDDEDEEADDDDEEEDDDDDDDENEAEEEDDDDDDDEDDELALANARFTTTMIEEPGKDSGCTAVVAVLQGRDLYVANAGDSRCVVCRNGKAIDMSLDHKPEDDEESERIIKAGGRVTLDGRVNGGLNLSRAIGDHAYKMNAELPAEEQMISALPDVKKLIVSPEDEFLVLACDGIWNCMSSEEVVDFVRLQLKDGSKKVSAICEELFEYCLSPNTAGDGTGCDNMTAVIVRFQPNLMVLPTRISPAETEDILIAKQAAAADAADASLKISLKRNASPTHLGAEDGDNEADKMASKTKRLKTDEDESSTSTNAATSSSARSTSPIVEAAEECDSVSSAALGSTC